MTTKEIWFSTYASVCSLGLLVTGRYITAVMSAMISATSCTDKVPKAADLSFSDTVPKQLSTDAVDVVRLQ